MRTPVSEIAMSPSEGFAERLATLDAGMPLRDVQLAARHADLRTTTVYDRRRTNVAEGPIAVTERST
jgi:hypothetical protein